MVDKKIVATMATEFSVDSTKAVESIKDLKSQVSTLGKEWKIQETQMKSAGDSMGATQVKVEGLTRQYETNGRAIDKIKADMSGLNREVASERDEYNKLAQQLLKAETQQNSLNSQLNRAESTLKGYKDGTIQLNKELKEQGSLTQATVERLQAEGRAEEANEVKLKGLADTKSRYNQLLTAEKSKLSELASTLGTNSSEYTKQATHVERLGTKLAHTTNEMRELSSLHIRPNPSGLNALQEKLDGLSGKLKTTQMSMSKMFMANFLANGAYGAFEHLKDKISDTLHEAVEYNKEQQVMNATWTTLTDSASKGKAMVKSINDISTAFGQSSDVTNELEQQFYHVFNQKAPTEELTKSMLTMGDTIGMNSESIQRLGLNFTHMLTSGRMQLGDFNLITDQLPMYGEKLLEFEKKAQHNTSLTMGELRKQMSAGKISADDATKVMNELGDKYKEASENMMGTASGMERVISARSKALTGALITPIMNAKNPLFGVISKWVSSSDTEKAFGNVGSAISKGFETITKAFGKNFKGKDATKSINDAINELANNITKFSDYIASHSKQITAFFKSVKEVGGEAFSTLKSTVQAFLPILKLVGGEAAKHPKLVGGMVVGWLSFGSTLKGITKLVDGVSVTFKTFQKVGAGFSLMFKKNEAGVSKLGKVLGGLKKTVGGLTNVFSVTFKGIGKAVSGTFKGATKVVSVFSTAIKKLGGLIGKTLLAGGKAFLTFGKTIGLAMKANPIGVIITVVIALGTALFELYKHNTKFRKFVDGVWKSVVQFIKPIGKLVGDMIDGIQDTFSNIGKFLKGFWNSTKKAWNTAIKWTQDLFNGLGKFFSQWWDNFTDNWSTLFNFVKKLASGFWDTLKGLFTVGFNTLKQVFNIFKDIFTGNWSKLGADVGRLVGYLWANVKHIFNTTYDWLNHLTGGWIGRTIEGFENFGGSIGRVFSKAWNGIKSTARDAMNGVIGIVNSGIRGIDGIIHDFGGPRRAIELIPKFAGGTGGAPKGLAMVNDQKGVSDAREAIVDNSGDVHILSGKNRIVNFSGGETVIPANVTREMFPHFASGTEGWFSKVVGWTKDKFEGITNFLKDPLSSISGVIGSVINRSLGGASSFVSSVAPAIGHTFSKAIVDPIKRLLNKLNEDAGGSLGNPGGAGVQRWAPYVKKALAALNLSTSGAMVARVLRQIATESGGNPTVHQQVNDINMRLGIPAQGLMQVIPPTFRTFALPGHGNILNGYDNILAGLNYAKHRYGSGLGALGNGHGYANGGLITQHQIAEIGEGNLPEMIIPLDKMKTSRAITLLQGAVNAVAHNNGVDVSNASQSGMSNEQANIMIALLTKLVSQEPTIEVHNEIVGDKITTQVNSQNSRRQNINNLLMGGI